MATSPTLRDVLTAYGADHYWPLSEASESSFTDVLNGAMAYPQWQSSSEGTSMQWQEPPLGGNTEDGLSVYLGVGTDYIGFLNAPVVKSLLSKGVWSIGLTYRPDVLDRRYWIFGNAFEPTQSGLGVYREPNGEIVLVLSNGSKLVLLKGGEPAELDNGLHSIVIASDGLEVWLIVDGVELARRDAIKFPVANNYDSMALGNFDSQLPYTERWLGWIDNLFVFKNAALTAEQAGQIMSAAGACGSGGVLPGDVMIFVNGEGSSDSEATTNRALGYADQFTDQSPGTPVQDTDIARWGAASVDGQGAWLGLPLEFGTSDWSISSWVNIDTTTGTNKVGGLIQLDDRGFDGNYTAGISAWEWDNGAIVMTIKYYDPFTDSYPEFVDRMVIGYVWPLNSWMKISITRNGNLIEVHFDGERIHARELPQGAEFNFKQARAMAANLGAPFLGSSGSYDNFLVTKSPLYTGPAPANFFDEESVDIMYPEPGLDGNDAASGVSPAAALYMPFDGSIGDASFTDFSGKNVTWLGNEGTPLQNQQGAVFGPAGLTVDGDDYVKMSASPMVLGTGDFTIEVWAKLTGASGGYGRVFRVDGALEGLELRVADGGFQNRLQVMDGAGLTGVYNVDGETKTSIMNEWHHYAIVRKNNVMKVFMDGQQRNVANGTSGTYNMPSWTCNHDYNQANVSAAQLHIGTGWIGHIDELYVTQEALYDSNFVVPTVARNGGVAPPPLPAVLMTMQSDLTNEGFAANPTLYSMSRSDVQSKVSTHSALFDAAAPFLYWPAFDETLLPDDDHTVEMWVRADSVVGNKGLFILGNRNDNNERYMLFLAGGQLACYAHTGGTMNIPQFTGATTLSVDTWYHVALTRSGNTMSIWLDGALEATGTFTGSFGGTNGNLYLGCARAGGGIVYWDGYMDGIRINNSAIYDAPFTPPATLPDYFPVVDDGTGGDGDDDSPESGGGGQTYGSNIVCPLLTNDYENLETTPPDDGDDDDDDLDETPSNVRTRLPFVLTERVNNCEC